MAGLNIGNVGYIFTDIIKDISETLNNVSKARTLPRQTRKWTGSYMEWPVHVGRSNAIQYSDDGGAFPVPDYQKHVKARAYRKMVAASCQLTDGVMATASAGPAVARSAVEVEVNGLMNDILKFENGFFFKDGTGVVATLKDALTSTTHYVDDARMLWDGQIYEWYDSTLATFKGYITVNGVTSAPGTGSYAGYAPITTSAAVTTVAGDKLVWPGSLNKAITGLAKLIDDNTSTFQNVNCTTYPRYTSLVLSNGSVARDLTPTLFRQMLAGIKSKCGAIKPADGLTVLSSTWDLINVEELYEGELRLSPSDTVGGLAVASFKSTLGKIDIIDDADAPYGKMFFCDFSQIVRAVQKELDWRRQGSEIFLRSDTAAVHTATVYEICELFIKNRFSSGVIEDLSVNPVTMY